MISQLIKERFNISFPFESKNRRQAWAQLVDLHKNYKLCLVSIVFQIIMS